MAATLLEIAGKQPGNFAQIAFEVRAQVHAHAADYTKITVQHVFC